MKKRYIFVVENNGGMREIGRDIDAEVHTSAVMAFQNNQACRGINCIDCPFYGTAGDLLCRSLRKTGEPRIVTVYEDKTMGEIA